MTTAASRTWKLALIWTLLLAATSVAAAPSHRLTGVDAVATAGNGINIRLTLDSAAPTPSVFTVNEPARLSIDLPATALDVSPQYQRIDQGPVQAIALAASGERTRVVVELSTMVDYNINRQGNEIIVGVGAGTNRQRTARPGNQYSSSSPGVAPTQPNAGGESQQVPAGPAVRDIDFRRGEKGAGRVEISLSNVSAPIDVREEGGQVVAQLPGVALPARLARRLDVLDFATPVKTIDATKRDGGTRIVVTPVSGADYEQIAYQTGDQFFIELQPLTPAEQAQREQDNPRYTGESISLSFQNVDVRAVLQIIADVADVNMVVSDSVSGNMALRLEDVPWDQALDIIMNAKNLGMRRENNVITVAPLAEITTRAQAELYARQADINLAPLTSEIIQINYARAGDIAELLRSDNSVGSTVASGGPADQPVLRPSNNDLSLLSTRGQVTVDERTNSLLVNETRDKLDEIHRVISRLDIPVRQVLIESRIVVANREFSRNLGVTQGVTDNAAFESSTGGNYLANSGYTVNLPVANPAGTITTSIIGDTFNLDLALSALESENRGEIISSPRVITADGKEAQIEQGQEVPYVTPGGLGEPATTEFKEVVLNLTVVPRITPNSQVIMSLNVTQDTVSGIAVDGQPILDTRALRTEVLVDDGETVVLGGIYEQENRNTSDRVPILSEIPILGVLFRGTQRQRDKRELLVFVTPKILREQLTLK